KRPRCLITNLIRFSLFHQTSGFPKHFLQCRDVVASGYLTGITICNAELLNRFLSVGQFRRMEAKVVRGLWCTFSHLGGRNAYSRNAIILPGRRPAAQELFAAKRY